jgi:alkylation response protein AidB-like acyl-CoA dehydrogenase
MGLMPAGETGPLSEGALSGGLLDRLTTRPAPGAADLTGPHRADPDRLAADLAVLRDHGYLTLALPARFGGAGLNLAEVACAQRQLAARAPAAAWAVNAHHAWVGAAADALASGDATGLGPGWVLGQAARGRMFASYGAGGDLKTPHAIPPATEGSALLAGMYAWGLALAGMTGYAIARRMFGQAVAQAERAGLSLDRWPVAEASLRLDDMRGRLDEVIGSWRQRVAAGGGLTTMDPGRLGLIRAFTARHVAADGAERVAGLAALIAGGTVATARA